MNPIIDPFARNCEFAWPYTNDIDTSTNAEQHLDAEEFLKRMKDMRFGGAILDPPFSNHQSREIYGSENLYTDPAKMKRIEMELGSLIELGGYVVKFGYNLNFSHRDCKQYSEREKVNDGIKGYHLVFSTQRGQYCVWYACREYVRADHGPRRIDQAIY